MITKLTKEMTKQNLIGWAMLSVFIIAFLFFIIYEGGIAIILLIAGIFAIAIYLAIAIGKIVD